MASIQKSFEQNLIKNRLLTILIIMKKVSLPRVYFPADLMNITSEFLLNHLRKRKSLIPLFSHRPFLIILRYTECPLKNNLPRQGEQQNEDRRRGHSKSTFAQICRFLTPPPRCSPLFVFGHPPPPSPPVRTLIFLF